MSVKNIHKQEISKWMPSKYLNQMSFAHTIHFDLPLKHSKRWNFQKAVNFYHLKMVLIFARSPSLFLARLTGNIFSGCLLSCGLSVCVRGRMSKDFRAHCHPRKSSSHINAIEKFCLNPKCIVKITKKTASWIQNTFDL